MKITGSEHRSFIVGMTIGCATTATYLWLGFFAAILVALAGTMAFVWMRMEVRDAEAK
jgi:hypothetical protein